MRRRTWIEWLRRFGLRMTSAKSRRSWRDELYADFYVFELEERRVLDGALIAAGQALPGPGADQLDSIVNVSSPAAQLDNLGPQVEPNGERVGCQVSPAERGTCLGERCPNDPIVNGFGSGFDAALIIDGETHSSGDIITPATALNLGSDASSGHLRLADETINLSDGTGAAGNSLIDSDARDLLPGNYTVTVTKPSGFNLSPQGQGGDDARDSDVDPGTGVTPGIPFSTDDLTVDAGFIRLSKTESADPVVAGSGTGNLVYTITAANNGPSDATGVTIFEDLTLPLGVTRDSVVPSAGVFVDTTAPDGTWTVDVAAETSETLTVTLTVDSTTAVGTDVISATATGTGTGGGETETSPGDESATESTSVEREVDLVVSKSESIDPVVAGSGTGNLVYVVKVTNNGPSDATGVAISEDLTLPSGVTRDSVVPSAGTFVDTTAPGGTWTLDLATGASETLTVALTVSSTLPGTDVISDTATVTGTGGGETLTNTGDDSATESTSVIGTTDVFIDGSSNLQIVDAAGGDTNDTLTVTVSLPNIRVHDPNNVLEARFLATQVDPHTVDVLIADITGPMGIIVDTLGGDDTLTVDFSGGNFTKGIDYRGGTQNTSPNGDILRLQGGGPFTNATFNYTNNHNGDINIDGQVIFYTGLEPITSTINATNVTLNYSGADETITVTDPGSRQTTVNSTSGETTKFYNPTGTLTIKAGAGSDTVNIDSLAISYPANLTIDGEAGSDTVNVNAEVSLGAGETLTVNGDTINVAASVAISTSGAGAVSFTADRNIAMSTGSSITTVDGRVMLQANTAGTATGNFPGIDLNDADITSTKGPISLTATGGDTGVDNIGVQIRGGSVVSSTGTMKADAATITINGTGGNGITSNHGVLVDGAAITSHSGDILINGTGAGTSGNGVLLVNFATIDATDGGGTGTASVDIVGDGVGGLAGIENSSATISSDQGKVTLTSEDDVRFGSLGLIDSDSGTVTVVADNAPGANGNVIDMSDGSRIDAGNGLIDFDTDGNINLASLLTSTEVRVTTTSGAITDNGNADADITASKVALRSATGIGDADALETAVSTLAAGNTNSGNIQVDNKLGGLLTIGTVDGLVGMTNADGDRAPPFGAVIITNASPVTVANNVSSEGDITITASDTATPNVGSSHLTLNATVTAGGRVSLKAGTPNVGSSDLTLNAEVKAGGQVSLTAGRDISILENVTTQDGSAKSPSIQATAGRYFGLAETAVLRTGTGSVSGQALLAAADVLSVDPVSRYSPFSHVNPEGDAAIGVLIDDPDGENFDILVDWNANGLNGAYLRGFPPEAASDGATRFDGTSGYELPFRYEEGNPNRDDPTASIPVEVRVRFDPRISNAGTKMNGIVLEEHVATDARLLEIGPVQLELTVPWKSQPPPSIVALPEVPRRLFPQPVTVGEAFRFPARPVIVGPSFEPSVVFQSTTLVQEREFVLRIVVLDNKGNPEELPGRYDIRLDRLLEGDPLSELDRIFERLPNGRYRIYLKREDGSEIRVLDFQLRDGVPVEPGDNDQTGTPEESAAECEDPSDGPSGKPNAAMSAHAIPAAGGHGPTGATSAEALTTEELPTIPPPRGTGAARIVDEKTAVFGAKGFVCVGGIVLSSAAFAANRRAPWQKLADNAIARFAGRRNLLQPVTGGPPCKCVPNVASPSKK